MNLGRKTGNRAKMTGLTMLFGGLLLAACSDPQLPPEEAVEIRAQARWDALVDFNTSDAWEYYTPGFRSTYAQRDFAQDMARRPIRWLGAEVVEVICDDDLCNAWIEVQYDAPGAPATQRRVKLKREIKETWLLVDGQWWYAEN